MPSILDYESSTSVMGGPRKLVAPSLSDVISQREFSLDWYSYYWNCNGRFHDGTDASVGPDNVWVTTNNVNNLAFEVAPFGEGSPGFSAVDPFTGGISFASPTANPQRISVMATGEAVTPSTISGTSAFWDTSKEPGMVVGIATDTNFADPEGDGNRIEQDLTNRFFACGFKLTEDADPGTDTDQAMWMSDPQNDNVPFSFITNTGALTRTGNPPIITTNYELAVLFDQNRAPNYYFNGALVGKGPIAALTTDMIPTISLQGRPIPGGLNNRSTDIYVNYVFICQRWQARP